jgi:hypothetical protein
VRTPFGLSERCKYGSYPTPGLPALLWREKGHRITLIDEKRFWLLAGER